MIHFRKPHSIIWWSVLCLFVKIFGNQQPFCVREESAIRFHKSWLLLTATIEVAARMKSTRGWCTAITLELWRFGFTETGVMASWGGCFTVTSIVTSPNCGNTCYGGSIILGSFTSHSVPVIHVYRAIHQGSMQDNSKASGLLFFTLTIVWLWTHLVTGRVCLMLIIVSGHP